MYVPACVLVAPKAYHSFQTPLSYMPARDLIEAVGTAAVNATTGRLACFRVRGGIAYEGIACAPGASQLLLNL